MDPSAGLIFQLIPKIMDEVGPIAKSRRNTQQGYSFRGIDETYLALQDVLARHGVFTAPEVIDDRTEDRTTAKGSALIYRVLKLRYRFYAHDGSFFDTVVIGEGMDSGDKASNKAMSVAHKYALLQVFAIPTEELKDPENDSHEVVPAVYEGQPQQKVAFFNACKDLGVGDKDIIVSLAEGFRGKAMTDVKKYLAEELKKYAAK